MFLHKLHFAICHISIIAKIILLMSFDSDVFDSKTVFISVTELVVIDIK